TMFVQEGTLQLNKSGAAVAVPGGIVIGDTVGADNADLVTYGPRAGSNQIADNQSVTVLSTGKYDLSAARNYQSTIRLLTLPNDAVSDTTQFTLNFLGLSTQLTYNSDADTTAGRIQAALDAIFGAGNFVVATINNRSFTISNAGILANTDLSGSQFTVVGGSIATPTLVPAIRGGSGNTAQIITPTFATTGSLGFTFNGVGPVVGKQGTESQQLTIDNTSADQSKFILTLNGVSTAPITFNANNSGTTVTNINAALDAAFPGTQSGGLFDVASLDSRNFTITAINELVNTNLPRFTITGSGTNAATGSFKTLSEGNGNEVQSLSFSGTGTATLSLGSLPGSSPLTVSP
ncbi:MAG: hypothetical protein JF612_14485, partial [Planctomycetia bacterium]|nr:hypothetical protein [Planctomycetia bacterium]